MDLEDMDDFEKEDLTNEPFNAEKLKVKWGERLTRMKKDGHCIFIKHCKMCNSDKCLYIKDYLMDYV